MEQLNLFNFLPNVEESLKSIKEKIRNGKGLNVLSLYNGISCGRVAFERAGISVNRYVSYEINKYANQIAQKNYPDDEYNGDVTTADFIQYQGFDILIGGSPCTYWSIAKQDREITPDGIGGQLFMHYVRALKESKCKYFLYENNYSIHKNIKSFISEQLGVEPIMINSALVSAQQRKRYYWTNIPNVQQPEARGVFLRNIIESGIPCQNNSYCITALYNGAALWNTLERGQRTMVEEPVGIAQRGRYINSGIKSKKVNGETFQVFEVRKDKKANCLTTVQKDSMVTEPVLLNTIKGKSQTIKTISSKASIANMVRKDGFGAIGVAIQVLGRKANADGSYTRVYEANKIQKANCITSVMARNMVAVPIRTGLYTILVDFKKNTPIKAKSTADGKIYPVYEVINEQVVIKDKPYKINLADGYYIFRNLTPIECERLQTLPDNYTQGVSDTQRHKCVGNGWTIEVITHILSYLKF